MRARVIEDYSESMIFSEKKRYNNVTTNLQGRVPACVEI